eukprot:g6873.t1
MESRLSSANYCTVVKGRRTGDILALDVDVVGDPLRPKEAVITASGLSGRPRAIACKTCRVTAGFGVHTWVSLEFRLPRGGDFDAFSFAYNPGWSSVRLVNLVCYDQRLPAQMSVSPPVARKRAAVCEAEDDHDTTSGSHYAGCNFDGEMAGASRGGERAAILVGNGAASSTSGGRLGVSTISPPETTTSTRQRRLSAPGQSLASTTSETQAAGKVQRSVFAEADEAEMETTSAGADSDHPRTTTDSDETSCGAEVRGGDISTSSYDTLLSAIRERDKDHTATRQLQSDKSEHHLRSSSVFATADAEVTASTSTAAPPTPTSHHPDLHCEQTWVDALLKPGAQPRQYVELLHARAQKVGCYAHLEQSAFVERALHAEVGVLLSLLPAMSLRARVPDPRVLRRLVPRLCDELENASHEAVAEKLAEGLLRIVKEYKKDNYALRFAAEEFADLYAMVKRLARSVRLSRMQNGTALKCNDIRDILARDFGT